MTFLKLKNLLILGYKKLQDKKNLNIDLFLTRSVNKATQYQPEDFDVKPDPGSDQANTQKILDQKTLKFIERVAFRVEQAYQSNEIINVFQDDFEMLGGEEAKDGSKGSTTSMQSRYFMDNKYCKGKRVSCIKFQEP